MQIRVISPTQVTLDDPDRWPDNRERLLLVAKAALAAAWLARGPGKWAPGEVLLLQPVPIMLQPVWQVVGQESWSVREKPGRKPGWRWKITDSHGHQSRVVVDVAADNKVMPSVPLVVVDAMIDGPPENDDPASDDPVTYGPPDPNVVVSGQGRVEAWPETDEPAPGG